MIQPEALMKVPRFISPFILLVAELSGLFSIIGTIFSVIFTFILFIKWDVSFFDVVTPSDILLYGLYWAVWILLVLVPVLGATWLVRKISKLLGIGPRWHIALFWLAILCGILGIFQLFNGLKPINHAIFGAISLVSSTIIFAYIFEYQTEILKKSFVIFGGASSICAYTLFYALIISVTEEGKLLVDAKISEECPFPRAVWVGTNSVIGRCVERRGLSSNPQSAVYIVFPKDSVRLISHNSSYQGDITRDPLYRNEQVK